MSAAPAARRTRPRHLARLAWLACGLALAVIVFGAFVRLSNAGLSCPDWPTCYGRAAWPQAAEDAAGHAATAIRPVQPHKAWREQLHRHLAALLGALVLVLAVLGARHRRRGLLQVLGAAALILLAVLLYMRQQAALAVLMAAVGEAMLLAAAWRWSRARSDVQTDTAGLATLILAVIVLQALLGMWTVTWLLKPAVVLAHLLGGMATFALLTWMAWRLTDAPIRLAEARGLRRWAWIGLALLGLQIALGGWVSANYAALACGNDVPRCLGRWWPPADFAEGFVLWRGIGVDYEGGVLDGAARIAIQLAHRAMAMVAGGFLLAFAARLLRTPGMRGWAAWLGLLVLAQVALGIANVRMGLPLTVAILHNSGAALLLWTLVTLLARLRRPTRIQP